MFIKVRYAVLMNISMVILSIVNNKLLKVFKPLPES